MRTVVLGGDGYCGWPTALHLSDVGHDVVIVDNFARRQIDYEFGAGSLTAISDLRERVKAWRAFCPVFGVACPGKPHPPVIEILVSCEERRFRLGFRSV